MKKMICTNIIPSMRDNNWIFLFRVKRHKFVYKLIRPKKWYLLHITHITKRHNILSYKVLRTLCTSAIEFKVILHYLKLFILHIEYQFKYSWLIVYNYIWNKHIYLFKMVISTFSLSTNLPLWYICVVYI